MPKNIAETAFQENLKAISAAQSMAAQLVPVAQMMANSLTTGGCIFICGNGGSASQAQHFAAEMVGRFLMERPALPSVALTTDSSILTAVGNDYGFEFIFERQVRALMKAGDVFWGLSTSGRSPNVLNALEAARQAGAKTILMCGAEKPKDVPADFILTTPPCITPRVQELHLLYGHTLCHLVEHILFDAVS